MGLTLFFGIDELREGVLTYHLSSNGRSTAFGAGWRVAAMHWILDMDFDEDRSRARREDLAENLAMPLRAECQQDTNHEPREFCYTTRIGKVGEKAGID